MITHFPANITPPTGQLTIPVTAEHIKTGEAGQANSCALALAIKEYPLFSSAIVSPETIRCYLIDPWNPKGTPWVQVHVDNTISLFMAAFDAKLPVEPCTLLLNFDQHTATLTKAEAPA